MKTITIECNGNESNITTSGDLTAYQVLGLLRYHERNIYSGLLNCNLQMQQIRTPNQEIYIHDLDISKRLYNRLKENKIETLSQLAKHSKLDLLKFRNFGKKLLDEVELIFDKYNLNLK